MGAFGDDFVFDIGYLLGLAASRCLDGNAQESSLGLNVNGAS